MSGNPLADHKIQVIHSLDNSKCQDFNQLDLPRQIAIYSLKSFKAQKSHPF